MTIGRIESGAKCRMDTKRKLILALGKKLQEKHEVFPEFGLRTAGNENEG